MGCGIVSFMAVVTVFGIYSEGNLFTKTGAVGAALAIYACLASPLAESQVA